MLNFKAFWYLIFILIVFIKISELLNPTKSTANFNNKFNNKNNTPGGNNPQQGLQQGDSNPEANNPQSYNRIKESILKKIQERL